MPNTEPTRSPIRQIRNILEFPSKWEHCEQISLVENYRSERGIVAFYNNWMQDTDDKGFEWGRYRYPKTIIPAKKNLISGIPTVIKVSGQRDLENWGDNIIDFINKLKSSGTISDYNQVAFLFRSVKGERVKSLADYLEKHGIPIYSPRSDMFFEREEIKLLIGALLVVFPNYLRQMTADKFMPKVMLKFYTEKCLKAFQDYQKKNPSAPLIKWCAQTGQKHCDPNASFDYAFTGLVYEILQFEPFLSIMKSELSGKQELSQYKTDIDVVDILHDRSDLQFKRDAEAEIVIEGNELVIKNFYPLNLMQKLSLDKETVDEWRQLVESVMIDFNYDGAVMQPKTIDLPDKDKMVTGRYKIPSDTGIIRVKITDVLSESLEVEVQNG